MKAITTPGFVQKTVAALAASRRALWLLCAVLALFCLAGAVKLAMLLVSPPELPVVVYPAAQSSPSQPLARLYPDSGPETAGETLTEAALDGELMGVVSSGGRAVASMKIKGREAVYGVGDELVPGVVVEAVEPVQVVVREHGTLRRISLKSLLDGQPGAGVTRYPAGPVSGNGSTHSGDASAMAQVTPVLTASGATGMRIDSLDGQLQGLDMVSAGDVILAVDGSPLSALMASGTALDDLSSRNSVSITLERNGQEMTVDISGDTVRSLMAVP